MFGEHLLRDATASSVIYITEGEKNAIFGALFMPDATWLAVGSSQDFGKVWKVKDILEKCGSVVFIPDADAITDWREKAKRLNLPNAKVSLLCAGHADVWDLADIIRDIYMQHPQPFKPTERREPTPQEEPSQPQIKYKHIPLFPDGYDYLSTFENITLPNDFFCERLEAAPF